MRRLAFFELIAVGVETVGALILREEEMLFRIEGLDPNQDGYVIEGWE